MAQFIAQRLGTFSKMFHWTERCMTKSRYLTGPPLFALLLFLFLRPPASSRAQSAPAPTQNSAGDVVMLSLQALNVRVEHGRHVRAGLLGNDDPELIKEKHLLEIQMNIVRKTAKFGPVMLLAPDETTKDALHQRCKEFQICDLLQ